MPTITYTFRVLRPGMAFISVLPGNGVSHQVHMERFGIPGKTLLGSDSHTPGAAGVSVLGIGAGGLDVALAMAGHPYHLPCPEGPWSQTDRRTPDMGKRKGSYPRDAPALRREGLHRENSRILRPGRQKPVCNRPGDHRQHGYRTRGHNFDFSVRRKHPRLPGGAGQGGCLDRIERGRRRRIRRG